MASVNLEESFERLSYPTSLLFLGYYMTIPDYATLTRGARGSKKRRSTPARSV
jgi:hypothetical protein